MVMYIFLMLYRDSFLLAIYCGFACWQDSDPLNDNCGYCISSAFVFRRVFLLMSSL